jgi:serine/threonine-protein kinase RsbW
MPLPETKKLILDSTFEEMERIEPYVQDLKAWADFDDEDFNRIMLTLSEAVNNAIMHGNKQDANKQVVIQTALDNKKKLLTVSVEDEGEGFDPEDIPDPLKDENLMNQSGRGVYLIKQYADDIQFSDGGSTVTISFNIA